MLEPRAQHLLKTLIERYIDEGQPVGSRMLSRQSGLELSPATIRNVMADLEELGYIASPHTSAGRIPTAKGYRFFVDSLMVVKPLHEQEIQRLEGEFTADRPQQLVSAAATLLSQLTHFAGIVMTPKRREASFRHLEFLRLSERRVLLIIVTAEGDVQNRILHTDRGYSQSQLAEATHFLQPALRRAAVRRAAHAAHRRVEVPARGHRRADDGGGRGRRARRSTKATRWSSPASAICCHADDLASNMERLRQLFDLFEQKTSLLHLLDISQRGQGVQIYIGGESGLVPLDECSVVTAPYEVDGQVIGTLGVIGPTRMAYERVIPDRRCHGEAAVERAHAADDRLRDDGSARIPTQR